MTEDFIAYLKLRIIVAALNEGWGPKFEEYEHRYYPGFDLYTQEDYDALGDEQKGCYVLRSGDNKLSYVAFGPRINASVGSACRCTNISSLLTFKTYELAEYAVMQFTEEWADFMFKPRTGEELNEKQRASESNSSSLELPSESRFGKAKEAEETDKSKT